MPIAFFFAILFTLQRLQGDSELVVMASAGYSLRQLAVPVLGCAALVMALTYACVLYLAPAGQRAQRPPPQRRGRARSLEFVHRLRC